MNISNQLNISGQITSYYSLSPSLNVFLRHPYSRLKLCIILHINVIFWYTFSQDPKCFLQRIYHNLQLYREFVKYLTRTYPNLTVTSMGRGSWFFSPQLLPSSKYHSWHSRDILYIISDEQLVQTFLVEYMPLFRNKINVCKLIINKGKGLEYMTTLWKFYHNTYVLRSISSIFITRWHYWEWRQHHLNFEMRPWCLNKDTNL